MSEPKNLILLILATIFLTFVCCLILKKKNFFKKILLIFAPLAVNYLVYLSFSSMDQELILLKFSKNMQIIFKLEPIGVIFSFIIASLWLVTNIYSLGFISALKEEKISQERGFFEYLTISVFLSMCLAYAGNLFSLFCFYELLTFCTYPLIIYYRGEEAVKSGKIYLYYLLGSSCFLLLPLVVILYNFEPNLTFNREKILFYNYFNDYNFLFPAMLIFGIAKMAIFPLHKWLPLSMVAPAPVSGLLHSVTIVKAGIFTLIKISLYVIGLENLKILLNNNIVSINFLTWSSGFTIIFASLKAVKHENFKKIFAYSTISQLSNCLLAFSLSSKIGLISSILQVVSHSFAKITLFFSAGIIQILYRKTAYPDCKNLYNYEKLLFAIMTINGLSLMSVPPFLGFWGKYYSLGSAIAENNWPVVIFASLSSILTGLYILPMIYNFIFAKEGSDFSERAKIDNVSIFCLYLPIIITSLINLIGGLLTSHISKFIEEKLW